jgi:hypothetical protein
MTPPPNPPTHCRRCEGRLERGFLVDHGDMHVQLAAAWASGEPQTGFWRTSAVGRGERRMTLASYRCTCCGLLETYAHGE